MSDEQAGERGATAVILRGGRVIDPAQGIDRIADVQLADGRIAAVGDIPPTPTAQVIDVSGCCVSPGWIDIHVHAYGTLGFADPDSIGVYQGVTTYVDAGGAGIGVMDEFDALMDELETELHAGPFIRPLGLIGLNYMEGDVRSLGSVPIAQWIDYMQARPGGLRYLKCNAMGDFGPGSLKLAKGLAEILGLPLYMHIGEFQGHDPAVLLAPEAFRIAGAGDMITHIYHGNTGGVLDAEGRVLPIVREAERRGVLFDVGFGGYNFSWDVAEKAFAQGVVPHTISSDLQQFNVVNPVKSLANVMSAVMQLGMPLVDAVDRVTRRAAAAVNLDRQAGSLAPGRAADVTVFRVEDGEFELSDCHDATRTARRRLVPAMCFKRGKRFDADLERAQAESNWFLQFAEEHVPAAAAGLSAEQRDFLRALGAALRTVTWQLSHEAPLDPDKALELQALFHAARKRCGIALKPALLAVYACFVDHRFTLQIGLFLMCLEREFALRRLDAVAPPLAIAA